MAVVATATSVLGGENGEAVYSVLGAEVFVFFEGGGVRRGDHLIESR